VVCSRVRHYPRYKWFGIACVHSRRGGGKEGELRVGRRWNGKTELHHHHFSQACLETICGNWPSGKYLSRSFFAYVNGILFVHLSDPQSLMYFV